VLVALAATGPGPTRDAPFALAMLRCSYALGARRLLSLDELLEGTEDPRLPVPAATLQDLGLGPEALQGQAFNDQAVSRMLSGKPLLVAHRATRVRPFFDRRFPLLASLPWADSLSGVRWRALGLDATRVDHLLLQRGYFLRGGGLAGQLLGLAFLLEIEPRALDMLICSALRTDHEVVVEGNTYQVREQLKAWGLRFRGGSRLWSALLPDRQGAEVLAGKVSRLRGQGPLTVRIIDSTAQTRFKDTQND
ncbi:MAG: hypothetical protein K6A65_00610, partial [Succinivibrionaceae bacterium]|nr:hypothetical protein [Succinivibrionaceae bacterium]